MAKTHKKTMFSYHGLCGLIVMSRLKRVKQKSLMRNRKLMSSLEKVLFRVTTCLENLEI